MPATWFFKSRGPSTEDDYTWSSPSDGSSDDAHEILTRGYDGHPGYSLVDDESAAAALYDDGHGRLVLIVTGLIPPERPADRRGRPIRVTLLGTAALADAPSCRDLVGVTVAALRGELAADLPISFGTSASGGGFAISAGQWTAAVAQAAARLSELADDSVEPGLSVLFPDTPGDRAHVAAKLAALYLQHGLAPVAGRVVVLRTDLLGLQQIGVLRPWRSLSPAADRRIDLKAPSAPGPGLPSLPGLPDVLGRVGKVVEKTLRDPTRLLGCLGGLVVVGGVIAVAVVLATGGHPAPPLRHHAATSPAPGPPAASVIAWGSDTAGDLGDAGTAVPGRPVVVDLPVRAALTAAAAGAQDTLALTSAGQILAWGGNTHGQLGDGSTDGAARPVTVALPGHARARAVAAGCWHSLAVSTGGQVYAWGDNAAGQTGKSPKSTHQNSEPVQVNLPGDATATAVAAGCADSLALTTGGRVLAWGSDARGQLGNGQGHPSRRPVAVKMPRGVKVSQISAGCLFNLALSTTGQVYAWGDDHHGQLGAGHGFADSNVPVPVRGAVHVTAISAGCTHSLALTASGTVLAWGSGAHGDLGDGANASADAPRAVRLPGQKVTQVCAGSDFSLALTSGGSVLAWGSGASNQLGNGGSADSAVPVPAHLNSAIIAVLAAGPDAQHTVAIPRPPSTA
jgi:alpha-tubulin suppressor-like RCC1 family protein